MGCKMFFFFFFYWFQDMNNFESDPEAFARTFCGDMDIQDPEVGVRKAQLLILNLLQFS